MSVRVAASTQGKWQRSVTSAHVRGGRLQQSKHEHLEKPTGQPDPVSLSASAIRSLVKAVKAMELLGAAAHLGFKMRKG